VRRRLRGGLVVVGGLGLPEDHADRGELEQSGMDEHVFKTPGAGRAFPISLSAMSAQPVIAAAPVVGRRGVVAGTGRDAAYAVDDGFVMVLTVAPPLLPNGAQVARLPPSGAQVVVAADEVWDPTIRLSRATIAAEAGDDDLVRALTSRDPTGAAAAGSRLIGRGMGLTPEGDDLVCGVAAVVAASAWPEAVKGEWLAALIGRELRRRTTALSATLLELAVRGMGPEPLQAWLAGDASALARLEAIGHSTGRAIARGAAIALRHV
jgi:hypothetical protein